MLSFIIKLVLANLIGDFLLQPTKWVKHKEEKQHKSPYLYYHIGIHGAILLLLLRFNIEYWLGLTIILVSHFVIDLVKIKLTGKYNERILFFADQLIHFLIIAIVVNIYYPLSISLKWLYSDFILLVIANIVFLTVVSSVVMRVMISRWDITEITKKTSLENAGEYIGMLERLIVFGFIVSNHWEGIGFLIAAKSVFRFGDLSRSSDWKLTEYILIGTLISFGLAILSGVSFMYLLEML